MDSEITISVVGVEVRAEEKWNIRTNIIASQQLSPTQNHFSMQQHIVNWAKRILTIGRYRSRTSPIHLPIFITDSSDASHVNQTQVLSDEIWSKILFRRRLMLHWILFHFFSLYSPQFPHGHHKYPYCGIWAVIMPPMMDNRNDHNSLKTGLDRDTSYFSVLLTKHQ